MNSVNTRLFILLFAVVAAANMTLAGCASEDPPAGDNYPVVPTSGTGGQGASGSGASGTMVGPSGSGGGGTGGTAGTPIVTTTGGTGGVIVTGGAGGTGGSGGVPVPFDSGIGDGQAGTTADTGGEAGVGGEAGSTAGAGGTQQQGEVAPGCQGLVMPPVDDYSQNGPFDTRVENNTGPSNGYTLFAPTPLGEHGLTKHPIATWGNGITTVPSMYTQLLTTIASHGYVIIGSNLTSVTTEAMTGGLDWLTQQNDAQFEGKLATECALTIGYSWGGMGATNSCSHPPVVATISFHGLQGASERCNGPVLLFTSTGDTFVSKAGYVQPCYNRSSVQPTIMATLDDRGYSHTTFMANGSGEERGPAIAWLRLWTYGDLNAKKYFYDLDGAPCLLCQSPWTDIQRKNHEWSE
jgi:hypothetical protein